MGTPAVTTRGFGNEECARLSHIICDVLDYIDNPENVENARQAALVLCRNHPVYQAPG